MSCRKRILIIILILPLAGCSTFGFLFERLPWLTRWQLDRMFDLNAEQAQLAEHGAQHMQSWLREEGLPILVLNMHQARTLWRDGNEAQALQFAEAKIFAWMDAFMWAAEPHLNNFFMQLDAANLAHYAAYNDDKSEEWFAHLESDQAKQARRIEQIEDWFGDINDAQVDIVARHIALQTNEYRIRLTNNAHWKARFEDAVLAKDKQAIQGWLRDFSSWWTAEYTALREANRLQWQQALTDLLPTLSVAQKRYLDNEISEWIENFEEVIAED